MRWNFQCDIFITYFRHCVLLRLDYDLCSSLDLFKCRNASGKQVTEYKKVKVEFFRAIHQRRTHIHVSVIF